jgi:hypothetical protein
VVQESVGHVGKARLSVLRFGQYRLAAQVSGGRHERRAEILKQQVVQRTVGQHQRKLTQARRDARRHRGVCAPRCEHDRAHGIA